MTMVYNQCVVEPQLSELCGRHTISLHNKELLENEGMFAANFYFSQKVWRMGGVHNSNLDNAQSWFRGGRII